MPSSDLAKSGGGLRGFCVRFVVFFLPLLVIWFGLEQWMTRVPNAYSVKREEFKSLAGSLDTLVLGSSDAYWGIAPKYLSGHAFNLANAGQSPYYDDSLLTQVLPEMPKLRRVIFSFDYTTLALQMNADQDGGRLYYYNEEWNIPPERPKDWLDLRMWSRVTLRTPQMALKSLGSALHAEWRGRPGSHYKLTLPYHLGQLTVTCKDHSHLPELSDQDLDSQGWWCPEADAAGPAKLGPEAGRLTIAYHHSLMDVSKEASNFAHLEHMFSLLQQRHVEIDVVTMPPWHTYVESMDPVCWEHGRSAVQQLVQKYPVHYVSFLNNTELGPENYHDVFHLNPQGAVRFTKMLDAALPKSSPTDRQVAIQNF